MDTIRDLIHWVSWSVEAGFDYLVDTGLASEIVIGLVFLTFVAAIISSIRSHPTL